MKYMASQHSQDDNQILLIGAPFDSTCSYRPGTRFGPDALRRASYSLETYCPKLDCDLENVNFFDCEDLELPFGTPEPALAQLTDWYQQNIKSNVTPIMLGGEHSLSLAPIEYYFKKFPDLVVIQFDAHMDLRQDYLGQKYSHACAMRRVLDFMKPSHLIQIGIRSGTKDEWNFSRNNCHLFPFQFPDPHEVIRIIENRPVYLTIDLDVLDTSHLPGTGTPEPGGVSFAALENFLHSLYKNLSIKAMDVMELSPDYDHSGISSVVAAKVVRQGILSLSNR